MSQRTWAARVNADDVAEAAQVWADPKAPTAVLSACPERVMAFLTEPGTGEPGTEGLLLRVLTNPRLPAPVLGAILKRLDRDRREDVVAELLVQPPSAWVRLAALYTPVSLGRAVSSLDRTRYDFYSWLDPEQVQQRTPAAAVLRAFITSRDRKARALAAEAFDLVATSRHRYADGAVSAVVLAADPEPLVRRSLARNPNLRSLPDDGAGLAVRQRLLDDPDPTVRAAAIRNHVALTQTDVANYMDAYYRSHPGLFGRGAPQEETRPRPPLQRPTPVLTVADPLEDEDWRVRAAAIPSLAPGDGEGWRRILADSNEQVRAAVATRGWSAPPQVWRALARDPAVRVRRAVARARWVRPEILRMMTGDADAEIAALAQVRVTGRAQPTDHER
jgi:hypothetical protein